MGYMAKFLPVEMTTSHRKSSLTIETALETSMTNVQKDNLALNVETVIGNNPVATNVALNVEKDKETQNDGRSPGLNGETSLMDNSQQPIENDVRGLKAEMEPNMVEEKEGDVQTTETVATQEWQEDIEHLTDVSIEVNRTNAALGLLLLNSPRSTHIDTEDEELVENELLMPIGGEKQLDMVMEIEQQKRKIRQVQLLQI